MTSDPGPSGLPTPNSGLLLRATWALPMDGPPLRDAAVLIGIQGRIAWVGPATSIKAPPDVTVLDLGEAILLPGLINVHTHLELTGFEPTASGTDFPEWVRGIRRLKEARSPPEYREAARAGLRECWRGGVTTIADTGDSGATLHALAELGGSGVGYQEVFGPHPDQLGGSFDGLVERVRTLAPLTGPRVRLGVSPHAPYTVSGPLFTRVARWAREQGLPLATHVAESAAETELIARGSGPFAEAWKARGIPLLDHPAQAGWQDGRTAGRQEGGSTGRQEGRMAGRHGGRTAGPTPVAWLSGLGVLGPTTLCIHAIELLPSDIELLAAAGSAVAHCPVSNARHGHARAPLAALRSAGVRVGLGTDSVASVGRLNLFAEMRAAHETGGLSPAGALALGTLEGARALGLGEEIGTLTPGKWGDLIAVPSDPSGGADPVDRVLGSEPEDVRVTVLGGRIVHRA